MSAPWNAGRRLYALTRYLFDDQTLRQVIEPTLADLQHEVLNADRRSGGRTRALLSGYAAFWKVVALQLFTGRLSMDRRLIGRMSEVALLALIGYVLALRLLPLVVLLMFPSPPNQSAWRLYLAFQGLAAMMPFAVFAAVLWSARRPTPAERPVRLRAYALLTLVASLAASVVAVSVIPPLTAALDHGPVLQPRWLLVIFSWIGKASACLVFAVLAIAVAPYARRVAMFTSALVLVPLSFVVGSSLLTLYTVRSGYPSPEALLLLAVLPYLVVFCTGVWMIAAHQRMRNTAA